MSDCGACVSLGFTFGFGLGMGLLYTAARFGWVGGLVAQ